MLNHKNLWEGHPKRLIYFLSIYIIISLTPLFAQSYKTTNSLPSQIGFNYLTVNNGLSQNSITSILQDSQGLIWIASYDGLNRFDGFTTLVKRHEPKNENSLSENRLLCMAERSDGKIWIGTDGGGVNIYNPDTQNFSHYTVEQGDITANTIICLTVDSLDNIWIGTERGLTKATVSENNEVTFETVGDFGSVAKLLCDRYGNLWIASVRGLFVLPFQSVTSHKDPVQITNISDPYIISLFCDKYNTIWISTYNSFSCIRETESIHSNLAVTDIYSQVFDTPGFVVRTMAEDLDGNIWIGTEESGLFQLKLNGEGNIEEKYNYNTSIPFCNISDDRIRTLFVDKTNVLWIGFHKKGVNYADICGKRFHQLHQFSSPIRNELGYKGKFISYIYQDSQNKLWIIDEEEGVYIYNRNNGDVVYLNDFDHHKAVGTVIESRSGDIWLGTTNRLLKIAKQDADNKKYRIQHKLQYTESGNIRTMCEDLYGNIWFGSLTGGGLYRYNPQTNECTLYSKHHGIDAVKLFYVSADIYAPIIWVGTLSGGLIKVTYNEFDKAIATETYNTSSQQPLSSNHIWHIYSDDSDCIWAGTDAGLNCIKLNRQRNVLAITPVNVPLLSGLKIMAITKDNENNFWLNCSQGLYKYNPTNEEVQVYTHHDGLQSNTFTEASTITDDGIIYVGGINGVNFFRPSEIVKNPYPGEPAIVNLRIHEKVIKPGEKFGSKKILEKDINSTQELVLDYKSNNFMFEFVGIHYAIPEKNQFQFMLEGFDDKYISTDSRLRVAAYSNLPAGKYTFTIKSSNNDGVWSEQIKKIGITILPPPWKTSWAYLSYFLLAGALIYFVIHYLLTKQRLKNQLYIERIEKKKIEELNEMKMDFFTNITHEFRTPLILILSPLKDLMSDIKKQNKHVRLRLQIINRNATRLLSLINQTLDLRQISSDTMKLLITKNSLHNHIENMIESFEIHTLDREISIRFRNEITTPAQWYDKYKIDKVLLNILSNAVKHTPAKGLIDIHVTENNENDILYAIVSVKDTGKGIPPEELSRIFEMFYRARNSSGEGTGIGLSYVKSLLNIHKGNIRVESTPGNGTCFTFRFPVNQEAYRGEQISETIDLDFNLQPQPLLIEEDFDNNISTYTDDGDFNITNPSERAGELCYKILIIEDNVDLRMYIKDCLSKHYLVIEASNGLQGIKTAVSEQPDLIITDIMMPVMNGIEFCKALKADVHTRHIPVFVHSVKSDEVTLKEAMDAGAEDFIAKPYDYFMLIKKIRNFFKTREQLVARAQAEVILTPTEPEVPSSDDELIRKVSRIIEQNLSNSEFSVENLADQVGMSRMQLHRRIIAITGLQTSTLIRDIRLQRAAQLLKTGEKRISEVMWETGFNNHSRFNKYFKMKYGVGVKEYALNNKTSARS